MNAQSLSSNPATLTLVLLESPYAGETKEELARNVAYARAAMHDCFLRGEAPYASHLLYTQPGVLRDELPEERKLGIEAGLLWGSLAEKTVVYQDLGLRACLRRSSEPPEHETNHSDMDHGFTTCVQTFVIFVQTTVLS